MKKNYALLWLLSLLTVSFSYAQNCPEVLGASSNSTLIHFKINDGTCSEYPSTIYVSGSEFEKASCSGEDLKYELTSGAPITPHDTFSSDFGQGMICDYLEGLLRQETLSVEQFSANLESLRIYPNPLTSSNVVNVRFNENISASIQVFDLTGKIVLKDEITNSSSKGINISGLNNGIFMLQISGDNASITRKIVVMK